MSCNTGLGVYDDYIQQQEQWASLCNPMLHRKDRGQGGHNTHLLTQLDANKDMADQMAKPGPMIPL